MGQAQPISPSKRGFASTQMVFLVPLIFLRQGDHPDSSTQPKSESHKGDLSKEGCNIVQSPTQPVLLSDSFECQKV